MWDNDLHWLEKYWIFFNNFWSKRKSRFDNARERERERGSSFEDQHWLGLIVLHAQSSHIYRLSFWAECTLSFGCVQKQYFFATWCKKRLNLHNLKSLIAPSSLSFLVPWSHFNARTSIILSPYDMFSCLFHQTGLRR